MEVKVAIRKLRLSYNKKEVLKGIDLDIYKNRISGLMGPAASGKSSLISGNSSKIW
jgi:ABC-type phosphate transport system ATPase subunit